MQREMDQGFEKNLFIVDVSFTIFFTRDFRLNSQSSKIVVSVRHFHFLLWSVNFFLFLLAALNADRSDNGIFIFPKQSPKSDSSLQCPNILTFLSLKIV